MLPCVWHWPCGWSGLGTGRHASVWLAGLALAAGLTMATKVAFIGWGLGIASLDFTGISGHAMLSAATWPVLLGVLSSRFRPTLQWAAVAAGFGLALLVAYSRVVLGAHSPSEVVAGFLLGALVSGLMMGRFRISYPQMPVWLVAALAVWLVVMTVQSPASNTQGLITRLALHLANHPMPFTRAHMHKKVGELAPLTTPSQ